MRTQPRERPEPASEDVVLERAAAGDSAALQQLIELSLPLIRQSCPSTLGPLRDDIQQIVAYRLLLRFRSASRPYRAAGYLAYRAFVRTITTNVLRSYWRREGRWQSLEALVDRHGFEPRCESDTGAVHDRLRLERCEELLPDNLTRSVFHQRFVLQRSVDETTSALARCGYPVTSRDVYRMAEHSIHLLSREPEVRDMFEALGSDS